MPVKIKGVPKLIRKMKRVLPAANSLFAREMKATIVDILVEKITSGFSPVKGKGKYKKYSDGYAAKKGRSEPVDLVATGEMLDNLVAKQTSNGNIIVEFKGARNRKLAAIHNRKNGKMPERKMLPSGNQTFKDVIMKKITAAYREAFKKASK